MRLSRTLLAATAATLFAAAPASAADFLFDFSGTNLFGGQPIVGNGTFTTDGVTVQQNGRDAQKITGITGFYNGFAITGLNPSIFGADNFYYESGQFVSGNGLGFDTAAGTSANLFASTGRYRVNTVNPFQSGFVEATAIAAPVGGVPEPTVWAMMMLGFGLVGAALRRRPRPVLATA